MRLTLGSTRVPKNFNQSCHQQFFRPPAKKSTGKRKKTYPRYRQFSARWVDCNQEFSLTSAGYRKIINFKQPAGESSPVLGCVFTKNNKTLIADPAILNSCGSLLVTSHFHESRSSTQIVMAKITNDFPEILCWSDDRHRADWQMGAPICHGWN